MNKEVTRKLHNLKQRKQKIRSSVSGTSSRPRLTVTISNLHISAQIIDDSISKTLASASTVGKKLEGNLSQKAETVGKDIAKAASAKKVSEVVFDRNGKKYHGRVKAFADGAREGGLKF
jgi:large subunit ribosomal protein L18